ncbi:hypothetical protein M406DRAFT_349455 [Cryphonectria parasitica EP155]|uniref:Uncharacterized protein n=1 Tax=Cryphonectria parasitica (strain ATCC 38755 / EP155) TaxID=660469 RepID=A0A9P4YCF0_CRYP1|nr:uncharacterized protein M406DRAFT_349455 [Cryphonectria parasitica EP155]KAF3770917.1 hypothetical protein M406DRAFT_349455 [Cryphonectria parasitica EP155]
MLESQAPRRRPLPESSIQIPYSHSRTRSTSSGVFPVQVQQPQPQAMYLGQPQQYGRQRRTPSVNTFSSVSSGGGAERGPPPPAAYRNSPPSMDLRRSTSSRSNGSVQPLSYVALLRKQKATVWCDRAQPEDPYMLAKQKQAKMRALQTVGSGTGSGTSGSNRTSTGLSSAGGKVVGKIRHHGKPAVVGYSPDSNYVGVGGVPLRLSATEVEGEDSDDDDMASQRLHHRRTGSSGRSSTAGSIGRRGLNYRASTGSGLQMTGGGSQNSRRWTGSGGENTPERRGSLADAGSDRRPPSDTASGSSSMGERADDVPDLDPAAARLASNSLMNATLTREKSVKNPDELRRRGSVDERTMTLTSGRLFIANPD